MYYTISESIDHQNKMWEPSRSKTHNLSNSVDHVVPQYSRQEYEGSKAWRNALAEVLLCVSQKQIFLPSPCSDSSGASRNEGSETEVLHVVQTLPSKLHNHFQGRWAGRGTMIRCSWPLEDLKPEQAKNRSSTECIDATMVQRLKGRRLDQAHLRKFSNTKT